MPAELTERQRRFIEAYVGPARANATEAARMAGYKGNDVTLAAVGSENLRKPQIRSEIDRVLATTRRESIADIVEIHETLTELLRTTEVAASDRIKAGVELAKMRGQYAAQKVDVDVKGVPVFLPDNGRDA